MFISPLPSDNFYSLLSEHYNKPSPSELELYHHGILGMKWGVRRYQNKDGTLTKAGKERYGYQDHKELEKAQRRWDKAARKNFIKAHNKAVEYAREVLIPEINKKYADKDLSDQTIYQKYIEEYNSAFQEVVLQKLEDLIGKRPE